MKRILLILLLLGAAATARAQKGTLTATVVDGETNETVIGAVVSVLSTTDPEFKKYVTSGYGGAVSVPSLPYGRYEVKVSFLGYNEFSTTVELAWRSKPSSRRCRRSAPRRRAIR